MTANGDFELSDIPRLLETGGIKEKLQARAALMDECERLMSLAEKESRGLAADERRTFDQHFNQILKITADLEEYKRQRIAEHGAEMIHFPI